MNSPAPVAAVQVSAPAAGALRFPFAAPPAPGHCVEVADGIRWLRMPLPFALDHINLWLLRDGDGWSIVDCGIDSDDTRRLWQEIFLRELDGAPVKRVLVTHFHPDHFGLAGWLTRRFQVPLWITRSEFLTAHAVYSGTAGHSAEAMLELFVRHGLEQAVQERLRPRGNGYPRLVSEPPSQFQRLFDDDEVAIDGRPWRIMIGYGHAPEHAALYCAAARVLIVGDMVLPRISTNVSVTAVEPDGDPLDHFLRSTRHYAGLPEDVLVLPSHGLPFYGLQVRVAQLHEHHAQRLQELEAACERPVCAAEVLPVLFKRTLDDHQMSFAMGEAIAHLNHLMYRGRLLREAGGDAVLRFAAPKRFPVSET